MKVNEFGAPLDKNGYAPSILTTEQGKCYLCENCTHTERHEIFGGSNRTKSKALGLWVNLCPHCHRTGENSVHLNSQTMQLLKRIGQSNAMETYDWSTEEFRKRFGKNYIGLEVSKNVFPHE